ncbi:MAG: bifunctional pyr operon transcriptional regulator/uracil phosphoribosyltransferase PyrR [Chloroflexi bacterium]|nr:bifunctional pyr operon transcriptional regulator/uracil phosphoribosyltransferase PyrR [Chloroflexota bacterium]
MTDTEQNQERTLMTGVEVRRALARMAHEIIERNHGAHNLVIAGVPTRGKYLSIRLADLIERFESIRPRTSILDPSNFRDDAHRRHVTGANGAITSNGMDDVDITGTRVVVVDDVFHTGRTARAALDALMQSGRPAYVQLAALINRGHRELPISPDFVGRHVPTARTERVLVRLQEVDGEDRVALTRTNASIQHRGAGK